MMMSERKRIYVLDTNVLMHDPTALFRFEEHDVFIPMTVLEELDNGKKGTSEVARNARQVSRFINELIEAHGAERIERGLKLVRPKGLNLRRESQIGRLLFQTSSRRSGEVAHEGDARQPDPGRDRGAASTAPANRRGAGVEGHQPAHQGVDLRRAGRGLRERPRARRLQPALYRTHGTAGRLLEQARQGPALVVGKGAHFL